MYDGLKFPIPLHPLPHRIHRVGKNLLSTPFLFSPTSSVLYSTDSVRQRSHRRQGSHRHSTDPPGVGSVRHRRRQWSRRRESHRHSTDPPGVGSVRHRRQGSRHRSLVPHSSSPVRRHPRAPLPCARLPNKCRRAQALKIVDPDSDASLGRNQPGEICICGEQIVKAIPAGCVVVPDPALLHRHQATPHAAPSPALSRFRSRSTDFSDATPRHASIGGVRSIANSSSPMLSWHKEPSFFLCQCKLPPNASTTYTLQVGLQATTQAGHIPSKFQSAASKIMGSRNEIVEYRNKKIKEFMQMEEEEDDELFFVIVPAILKGLSEEKRAVHTSEYTGAKKMMEILAGHEGWFRSEFRMEPHIFKAIANDSEMCPAFGVHI